MTRCSLFVALVIALAAPGVLSAQERISLTVSPSDVLHPVPGAGDGRGVSSVHPWTRPVGAAHTTAVFLVTTTNDTGDGSLRKAMLDANANPGRDLIAFGFATPGIHTIIPQSRLPVIVDPVAIDGTTQTGYAGTPLVEIIGSAIGASDLFDVYAPGCAFRGLAVHGVTGGTALVIHSGDSCIVASSFFGTDPGGSVAPGNAFNGVIVESAYNRIGGRNPGAMNLFAGNGYPAVVLQGPNAHHNLVQGNRLGTDLSGTVPLGNGSNGIVIAQGASDNTIGDTTAEGGNLVSGSVGPGIVIAQDSSCRNRILGNIIGADAGGTRALANAGNGIYILDADSNFVGDSTLHARNIIAGNTNPGVFLDGTATGNRIVNNFIGIGALGVAVLPNLKGIVLNGAPRNYILDNVIAGNTVNGVEIRHKEAAGNVVRGNLIGVDPTGVLPAGNLGPGILLRAPGTIVGGSSPGDPNVIAYNAGAGVSVDSGSGNSIRGNSIFDNGGLGIDIAPPGVARNDSLDLDAGPNDVQNFPVLDSARISGALATHILGHLDARAHAPYTVDFYLVDTADASHFGEGKTYLASLAVVTNDTGRAVFDLIPPAPVPTSLHVTATATDSLGNTSEFTRKLCLQDTDGDGVFDCWETAGDGIDVNADSVIDLDLASRGASPRHKDLFVEVDAMTGFVPKPGVLAQVQQAFSQVNNSYLNNPDGNMGIHLVIDPLDGDTTIPVAAWPAKFDNFHAVRSQFFGTQAERAQPNRKFILEAKRLVYRYCVFASNYGSGQETRSSGLAWRPGHELMVTFGGWTTFTANDQAGTFMHELGHTLGLDHGGGDGIHYKPNYISVMNYTWQVPRRAWQVAGAWTLAYSPDSLPRLLEGALDETKGLNPQVGHYPVLAVPFSDGQGKIHYARLAPGAGVDWDGNGDSTHASPSVQVDLNLFPSYFGFTVPASPGETLIGQSDWPALVYNFRDSSPFRTGGAGTPDDLNPDELTSTLNDALNSLPPPLPAGKFTMDGRLDSGAALLGTQAGMSLYAAIRGSQLYVAATPAASLGKDVVVFVALTDRSPHAAPLGKTGTVGRWVGALVNRAAGDSTFWIDGGEEHERTVAVDTVGTVLEGVVDLELLAHAATPEIFLAAGAYDAGAAGLLAAQVPAGNGNGDIDAGEYFDVTPAATRVAEQNPVPGEFALRQNSPNPFNPSTIIEYVLPARQPVLLEVFDILGRKVATLVDEIKPAGTHQVAFHAGGRLASGLYFYRITAGPYAAVKTMVLVK